MTTESNLLLSVITKGAIPTTLLVVIVTVPLIKYGSDISCSFYNNLFFNDYTYSSGDYCSSSYSAKRNEFNTKSTQKSTSEPTTLDISQTVELTGHAIAPEAA